MAMQSLATSAVTCPSTSCISSMLWMLLIVMVNIPGLHEMLQ